MRTDAFDFDLPEAASALRPAKPRDSARLLVVRPGAGAAGDGAAHPSADAAAAAFEDRIVRDLPALLSPGDILVLNDTRVIPARLDGIRRREGGEGAFIEANLIERLAPDRWRALARPGKRLKVGDRIAFAAGATTASPACALDEVMATVTEKGEGGEIVLAFDFAGPDLDAAVAAIGHVPLPPYIAGKRAEDASDREDYQTVFARAPGAVAAPTAGLHLTPELIARLEAAGIGHVFVTLHVGAGTFLPVKAETTDAHRMHSERGVVTAAAADRINAVRAAGGRAVAIGTTALRILESAAGEDRVVRPFDGATDIFITPGYRFRAVDALVTNFHLPRSTLFMLVSAFSGLAAMKAAYARALAGGYRFYSYGDGSLLFPADHGRTSADRLAD